MQNSIHQGEIRVHIENQCKGDVLEEISYIFSRKLGMTTYRTTQWSVVLSGC